MFRVQNIIDFRYIVLVFTCTLDLLFLMINTFHTEIIDKQILFYNLYSYIALISLYIIIILVFSRNLKLKFTLLDILLLLYFITKCFIEAFNTNEINNQLGLLYLPILYHLIQGTISNHYQRIVIAFLFFPFLVYSQIIQQEQDLSKSINLQIIFIVMILINEIINQTFRLKEHSQINEEIEDGKKQLNYLAEITNSLNLGIIAYDSNFKLVYRSQYMDIIEQSFEPIQQSVNVSYNNKCDLQNVKLLQTNKQEQSVFLDDLKVWVYVMNENTTKQSITLRQMIQNKSNIFNESTYFKVKLLGQNLEKIKYFLKYTQMNINNQNLNVFTFSLINDLIIYSSSKKDRKFRTNLISSFSHKLKTPLHAVISYLEICMSETNFDHSMIETYIKPCYFNSKILLYLIQDILDYVSFYSQQKQCLNVRMIDIIKLIKEIKDLIMTQCSQKGITFNISFNKNDIEDVIKQQQEITCYILSDLNKLMRILINLLNNAYRFTPQGGSIGLDVQEIKTTNSRMIQFIVSDNGVGLSQQAQDEILKQMQFHQQNQLQRSRKQSTFQTQSFDKGKSQSQSMNLKNEVLGISLKITTQLINQLNGSTPFQIESLPGQGSKFKFSISDMDIPSALYPQSARRLKRFESGRSNNMIHDFLTIQSESQNQVECENVIVGQIKKIDRIKPSMLKKTGSNPRIGIRQQTKLLKGFQPLPSIRICSRKSKQNLVEESGAIIVVDDEPFNHISLEMVLKSLGYLRIVHCYNGQEVVDFVKQQKNIKIRTVLMDIDMPVMDGIQATSILCNLMDSEKIKTFQIIACTAHDDEETKLQCYESGVDQIVVKPVFSSILKDALQIQQQ